MDVLDRAGTWIDVADLAAALDLPRAVLDVVLSGLEANDLVEFASPNSASPSNDTGGPWDQWSPAARLFHLATRDVAFTRRSSSGSDDVGDRPAPVLPPQGGREVALPLPRLPGTLSRALHVRRTHRRFSDDAVSAQDLGTLLGVTFGIQAWAHAPEGALALKTSPSGGARHSLEAYVWVRHVEGIAAGLYHYRGDSHVLSRLDDREPPAMVTAWLPAQAGYERAPLVVVLASTLRRVAWRYRSARAYRVVLIESGHLAQTFCLVTAALGLAPFCTAALADSRIEADLGLDGDASPVTYAMGAGHPAPGEWRPHEDRPAPPIEVTPLGRALDDEG
jgi:SagB-type dehydrogenase family enzyme